MGARLLVLYVPAVVVWLLQSRGRQTSPAAERGVVHGGPMVHPNGAVSLRGASRRVAGRARRRGVQCVSRVGRAGGHPDGAEGAPGAWKGVRDGRRAAGGWRRRSTWSTCVRAVPRRADSSAVASCRASPRSWCVHYRAAQFRTAPHHPRPPPPPLHNSSQEEEEEAGSIIIL